MDEAKQHMYDSESEESGMLAMPMPMPEVRDSVRRRFSWWRRRKSSGQSNAWKWVALIWAALSIVLAALLLWPPGGTLGTYEAGFATDMPFDHPIPLVKQRTHGRLRLYPNWTSYIADPDLEAEWPENLAYFGNPGEEEDKNWAVMMHDTHFAVTADEAQNAWGPDYQKYYLEEAGGYQAELAVFHALHCLNWVRKVIHPDEYPGPARDRVIRGEGHTNHCLEVLRQHIQCYGSTTLIPSQHSEILGRPYTDSDQMYTCRDFAYLRTWTSAKKNADRDLICKDGGESVWGTRCDGYPGAIDPSLWTVH